MGLPLIGLFVKGATHTIGFVKEANEARKEARNTSPDQQKSNPQVRGQPRDAVNNTDPKNPCRMQVTYVVDDCGLLDIDIPPPDYSSEDELENTTACSSDKKDPQIQETNSNPETLNPSLKKQNNTTTHPTIPSLVSSISLRCTQSLHNYPLRCPIVLPQRRPGTKSRGFLQAYAPDLADFGIPQDAFLLFLKHFHAASQASQILNVIYISSGIVGLVPHLAPSTIVQVAAGAAMEVQRRYRMNGFLEEMNERIFKPKGLFALVMCYKPEGVRPLDARQVDLQDMVVECVKSSSSGFRRKMKLASGDTFGDIELPQSAPLVYPPIDHEAPSASRSMTNIQKAQNFLSDYQDRRAQAIFASQNPTSPLRLPDFQPPVFSSRFSDPTDPIHDGSLTTLLRYGFSDSKAPAAPTSTSTAMSHRPAASSNVRKQAKRRRKVEKYAEKHGIPLTQQALTTQQVKAGKRAMKRGVLYLMIVNLPRESTERTH